MLERVEIHESYWQWPNHSSPTMSNTTKTHYVNWPSLQSDFLLVFPHTGEVIEDIMCVVTDNCKSLFEDLFSIQLWGISVYDHTLLYTGENLKKRANYCHRSEKLFTFYGDGVWQKDGAADTVDPWENYDHVTLMARVHRWYWVSMELNTRSHSLSSPTVSFPRINFTFSPTSGEDLTRENVSFHLKQPKVSLLCIMRITQHLATQLSVVSMPTEPSVLQQPH